MQKVLLIQDVISSYRVPVYNLIAKKYDLTVLYTDGKVPESVTFPVIQKNTYNIGPFKFYTKGFNRIIKQYDIVIFQLNPFEASLLLSIIRSKFKNKIKFIPWGIGVPASYCVRFDDPSKQSYVRRAKFLIDISDAVIFYTDYPVNKYKKLGVNEKKMFVAHNTVAVLPHEEGKTKDSILFVGTLYKAKSSMKMLEYYRMAYEMNHNIPLMRIVGGGDEFDDILEWVKEHNLNEKIRLEGPVFDEYILRAFFEGAFACVSLGQAGLSVQKSMGYGVPFITTENAYTGGERLDIINRENGVLLKEESDLTNVILEIASNPEIYQEMGNNAFSFYVTNRTVDLMAKGVCDAIESVVK